MPATPAGPAPEGRRVHFSPETPTANTLGGVGETRALRHQSHRHGHQSDPQADDPFVGPMGNVIDPVFFIYLFIKIMVTFLKFITG